MSQACFKLIIRSKQWEILIFADLLKSFKTFNLNFPNFQTFCSERGIIFDLVVLFFLWSLFWALFFSYSYNWTNDFVTYSELSAWYLLSLKIQSLWNLGFNPEMSRQVPMTREVIPKVHYYCLWTVLQYPWKSNHYETLDWIQKCFDKSQWNRK